ncbi:MAG: imidazole glycerol phosphate synthase subunit HisH [Ilumatobacteraceae bacterium]|nr:imidazole glycerol phosphate synthase subunit HisH [Ilumatobacteraceae bacterium]MBL6760801.1 imidazole glycerol phosphate synthase subunit HisH [Ilumatobacteraceae bacterium]MDA2974150.1 imidazole glycerol phosphate synthase subunit HisH [Actinomycetota bacterium]
MSSGSDSSAPVAVVDYGIGNLHSAHKAFLRVGVPARLTNDPGEVEAASAVVLPGVGNFGACMRALRASGLLNSVLSVLDAQRPFLGICVGMQMLFEGSEESPDEPGLGVLKGRVEPLASHVKRPQMQWNRLSVTSADEVLVDGDWMYFVHSLAARPTDRTVIAAEVDYGGPVVAAVRSGNILATQFHPEKSGSAGLELLRRWAEIR